MLAEDQTRVEKLLDARADPRLTSIKTYPKNEEQMNAFEASLLVNNQQLITIVKDNLGSFFYSFSPPKDESCHTGKRS